MKTSSPRGALLFCALFFLLSSLASANLITNGDFETGNLSGWTTTPAASGSFFFVDSGGFPDATYGVYFGATDAQFDSISQTFATVAGSLYDLSFFYQVLGGDSEFTNGGGGQDFNHFRVLFDGVVVFDNLNANPSWSPFTFSNLLATTNLTTVTFQGFNGPSFDFLDDVVVNGPAPLGVPDSGTSALLLGLSLPGLFLLRRRVLTPTA